MATSHFERFLLEATAPDETHWPLGPDCLYGLYTSWCLLHSITPVEDITFRTAMQRCGVDLRNSRRRMTGQAATDYILDSYPRPPDHVTSRDCALLTMRVAPPPPRRLRKLITDIT